MLWPFHVPIRELGSCCKLMWNCTCFLILQFCNLRFSLSLARSLDHSMSLCMVSGNFTRSISPSLCFGWFHRSLPQVSKIYSQVIVSRLPVWSCVCGYQSAECRYNPSCIHADCWHVFAVLASESCYWKQPR